MVKLLQNNLGNIYTKLVSKDNGELDMDYINSIKKPPRWVIDKAIEKLKRFTSQAEIQEMLIGVTMTPDGVIDHTSFSKTKWRPMYVPESVLDQMINNQDIGNEKMVALKIGYKKLFDSLGKYYCILIRKRSEGG